jgi:glyoxylase-like metal-dependent hydrolase (beta-lactamase superfamily II)
MAVQQIVPGVYAIPIGVVNAFLIDTGRLTLIDSGVPGSAPKILQAVQALGKEPTDIEHILVTHCHADHTGSLAALKAVTGAPAFMHPADAALVRAGQAGRPMKPAPGLVPNLLFRLFTRSTPTTVDPAAIEHEVYDGQELEVAGGIRAIHVPGHCAGQLAFLWPHHGGVLFVADAAIHMLGRLGPSIVYEDLAEGQRSLTKLAALNFAVACFGHGKAIIGEAAEQFRQKWGHVARTSMT